jgi:hypothetical protein
MIDAYTRAKALFELSASKREFMQYANHEESEMWDELLDEYLADWN